jgi:hypothetical protein
VLWAGASRKDDVMRTLRRVVLVLAVALVGAGAGSALLASVALAGIDSSGRLHTSVYNTTPYTWTLVASGGNDKGGFNTGPASTLSPGQGTEVISYPWDAVSGGICLNTKYQYAEYFTYRVDVLGGPPEYVTVAQDGEAEYPNSGCFSYPDPLEILDWITVAPPPQGFAPTPGGYYPTPAARTANPQVTAAPFTNSSLYYYIAGNYTVDASTASGEALADVLNAMCSGASNTSCSFTQVGPLTWGIGTPVKDLSSVNCAVSTKAGRRTSAGGVGDLPPNYTEMSYTEATSASLTVGGGLTATAEFNLFDTISGKISVSVQAQHEWQKTDSLTRQTYVYIPSNDIASVWLAPTVGNVNGTLVVSNGGATFTVDNFTEVRSGVTKDALTPAFDVITKVRPMTTSEYKQFCASTSTSTGLGATHGPGPTVVRPPVRLVAGRGVARVALGQTRAAVARWLGRPRLTLFSDRKCPGLDPGCDAIPDVGGISVYRRISVLFGADSRVSGLIYRGPALSAKGVGVGSVVTSVRSAYPGAVCTGYARQRYCTVSGVFAGRAVKTVFRFSTRPGGGDRCDRVVMYFVDPRGGQVGA